LCGFIYLLYYVEYNYNNYTTHLIIYLKMNLSGSRLLLWCCFFLAITSQHHQMAVAASGDGFRFANNYGSNMVLQRAPLNAVLWGFGEENQIVRIQIGAGTPLMTTVTKGIRNIMMIWICVAILVRQSCLPDARKLPTIY